MIKLSKLILTLESLGFRKEALLIKIAMLEKFEPAAWNICLREILKHHTSESDQQFIRSVNEAKNKLTPEQNDAVNNIIKTKFEDKDRLTLLKAMLNCDPNPPSVVPQSPWKSLFGIKPKPYKTPKHHFVDPSNFDPNTLLFAKDIDDILNKTKLTTEIIDQWILSDFARAKLDNSIYSHNSKEEAADLILNEPDLKKKYILVMNLFKRFHNKDKTILAEKLLEKVLEFKFKSIKRHDDSESLDTAV
jgi:hypothetical protein